MDSTSTNQNIKENVEYLSDYVTYESNVDSSTNKDSELISYSKRIVFNSENSDFNFDIDLKKQRLQDKISRINSK